MDIGTNFFIPIANIFYEWLTIPVLFFGTTIPLYVFILFGMLVALFLKILSIIASVHV